MRREKSDGKGRKPGGPLRKAKAIASLLLRALLLGYPGAAAAGIRYGYLLL
jgi:hypothetical protein